MAWFTRRGLGGCWWGGGAAAVASLVVILTPRVGVANESTVFTTPPGMAPAVRFWVDAFTRYGRNDVAIVDRVEPGVVYEVVRDVAPGDARLVRERLAAVADLLTAAAVRRPDAHLLFGVQPANVEALGRLRIQRGLRETFAQGVAAERLFRPAVHRALADAGLPLDLAALPLVESAYHPGRTSEAGASGLWQLTPEVAEKYLDVGGKSDQRRDPFRASLAAARYLRDLYDQFESWPLAITAYNHGPTGIERARQTAGTDDLGEIVRRYDGPGFGFASRSYYAEFLAARQVLGHVPVYFPELTRARMVSYRVKRGDTLERVAKRHGVSIPSLRVTNGIRSAMIRPGQVLLIRL